MKLSTAVLAVGFAVLLFGAYALVAPAGSLTGPGSTDTFRVTCSGVVEVDALGIGSPELDPAPTCSVKKCGFLSAPALSIFGEEGDVVLVVNGREVASQGFESAVGGDQPYGVTSSCVALPAEVSVRVYEQKDGRRVLADSSSPVVL